MRAVVGFFQGVVKKGGTSDGSTEAADKIMNLLQSQVSQDQCRTLFTEKELLDDGWDHVPFGVTKGTLSNDISMQLRSALKEVVYPNNAYRTQTSKKQRSDFRNQVSQQLHNHLKSWFQSCDDLVTELGSLKAEFAAELKAPVSEDGATEMGSVAAAKDLPRFEMFKELERVGIVSEDADKPIQYGQYKARTRASTKEFADVVKDVVTKAAAEQLNLGVDSEAKASVVAALK